MSTHFKRHLLGLSVLSLLWAAPAARAQFVFFPNDTTFDASNTIPPPGTAVIGYANFDDYINGVNGTSPTIRVVDGASVNAMETHNSSVINMSGGTVGSSDFLGELLSTDTSTVNISGGNIAFDLDVQTSSTVNFSGGTIGDDIVTHDITTVNMSGGNISQDLLANGNSVFNLRGGSILDEVFIQDSSTLNVFGTGLTSTLLDPNYMGFYSEYLLAGSLQDSTDLAGRIIFIQNDSGASFTLNNQSNSVPEPGLFALVMGIVCGSGTLLRQKRSGKRFASGERK